MLLWLLLTPFLAAIACFLLPSHARRAAWLVSVVATMACLSLLVALLWGHKPTSIYWDIAGLKIELGLDFPGIVLVLVTLVNGLLILVFSLDYLSPSNVEHAVYRGFPRYYGLFMFFVGAMIGVAMAQDLLLFSFFYELVGICSCLLIGYYREREYTFSGYKALTLTHVGGLSLLLGAALVYQNTRTLLFTGISKLAMAPSLLTLVGILFLVAGLAKSAQLPLHYWLPSAMVAPTTISAYLHAASMVNVGVFTMLRFAQYSLLSRTSIWPVGLTLLVLSLATMFYSATMHYAQRDMKRLLAYSTIAQLAYMLLAISFTLLTASTAGANAALYHLWNHSFAKALLFLVAGSIAYGFGSKKINLLRGLAGREGWKLVAASWAIGATAIVGVPPLNCFYSKLSIIMAGLAGNTLTIIGAILAIVESILTFIVFTITAVDLIAEPHENTVEAKAKPSKTMLFTLVCLIVLVIVSPYVYTVVPRWR